MDVRRYDLDYRARRAERAEAREKFYSDILAAIGRDGPLTGEQLREDVDPPEVLINDCTSRDRPKVQAVWQRAINQLKRRGLIAKGNDGTWRLAEHRHDTARSDMACARDELDRLVLESIKLSPAQLDGLVFSMRGRIPKILLSKSRNELPGRATIVNSIVRLRKRGLIRLIPGRMWTCR